jgi:hypothetical protein
MPLLSQQRSCTATSALTGQVRDCFGLLGEGSFRIAKPTWHAFDRKKASMAALDPLRPKRLSVKRHPQVSASFSLRKPSPFETLNAGLFEAANREHAVGAFVLKSAFDF